MLLSGNIQDCWDLYTAAIINQTPRILDNPLPQASLGPLVASEKLNYQVLRHEADLGNVLLVPGGTEAHENDASSIMHLDHLLLLMIVRHWRSFAKHWVPCRLPWSNAGKSFKLGEKRNATVWLLRVSILGSLNCTFHIVLNISGVFMIASS